MKSKVAILLSLIFVPFAYAFYLPGVAPHDYKAGEMVTLNVNSLTPSGNQEVESIVSFDYYNPQFHFCTPKNGTQKQAESIGSVLFGDRIFNSPFELKMQVDEACKKLCSTGGIPDDDVRFINERIIQGYAHNWAVDGLPAATEEIDPSTNEKYYTIGFKMGSVINKVPYINNHFDFAIHYHVTSRGLSRVVGVSVVPSSIYSEDGSCSGGESLRLDVGGRKDVTFTYSVKWIPSDTVWATRWDGYLHVLDPSIHWFSLINSIIIVMFLTGMISMILLRALHKDISRYNAVDQESVQDDYGWKLVHGDVFRPPNRPMLLSVLAGGGVQLMVMTGLTLVFAVLGFLSPSNRGSLSTMMLLFFMVFSCTSGYSSARIYKMNGGESWKLNMILTATLLPGALLGGLVGLNFFLVYNQSAGAVPFGTMMAIVGLWLILSFPLSIAGSYYGLRQPRIQNPVRVNQIPRQIPDQPLYMQSLPSILMGGILPFGAIFIELYFIMNSIWFHRIYYGIGFLFLVFGVLIMTCSQVAILMCYFHLCSEDYHWSWRSFLTAGATGFYVYIYSFLYYFTKLNINSFSSTVLYFGYSSMISVLLSIMTGSIGYLSCLYFLRKIFASIKVD
ncbi:hypothetical protein [Parasitella parasitica]|uniref:Transmembrane 9 superfamily member n=1 Tax=Parasitella parasitica TaxID=35722 RepID=A0A0B7MVY0_9FUNG|nr:hypothetical protein [Parasitella parasitica]